MVVMMTVRRNARSGAILGHLEGLSGPAVGPRTAYKAMYGVCDPCETVRTP
jgi:hypothetical protein